jgi:hypothetical protein
MNAPSWRKSSNFLNTPFFCRLDSGGYRASRIIFSRLGLEMVKTELDGRGDWIRTSDLPVPNRTLYQAEPRPDILRLDGFSLRLLGSSFPNRVFPQRNPKSSAAEHRVWQLGWQPETPFSRFGFHADAAGAASREQSPAPHQLGRQAESGKQRRPTVRRPNCPCGIVSIPDAPRVRPCEVSSEQNEAWNRFRRGAEDLGGRRSVGDSRAEHRRAALPGRLANRR